MNSEESKISLEKSREIKLKLKINSDLDALINRRSRPSNKSQNLMNVTHQG